MANKRKSEKTRLWGSIKRKSRSYRSRIYRAQNFAAKTGTIKLLEEQLNVNTINNMSDTSMKKNEELMDTEYPENGLDTFVDVMIQGVQRLSEKEWTLCDFQQMEEENKCDISDISDNNLPNTYNDVVNSKRLNNNNNNTENENYKSKVIESNVNVSNSDDIRKNKTKIYDQKIVLKGRRIVDIQHFLDSLVSISNHGIQFGCSLQNLKVVKETRNGLASKLTFKCSMCLSLQTVTTIFDYEDINKSAVLGITNVGSGYTHLNEIHSVINIPTLSSRTYNKIQESLADIWEETAIEEMTKAAYEEKQLAIEYGDLAVDGTPLVTVVCDGVWAKRSYRSNYNSLSGAAAIVGFRSKKVLFLAVKNKFCLTCKKFPVDTPQHKCYKNWYGSSSAMEAHIIAEGFQKSVEMYGIIYDKMVADGDSSCFNTILQKNPYKSHGITVSKVECRNHLLRNYIKKVRDLTEQKNVGPLIFRKEIKKNLMRFRYAVTEAIKHRKNETCILNDKINNLRKDILNSPCHILGNHRNCASYFCDKQIEDTTTVTDMKLTPLYDKLMTPVRYLANHANSLLYDVDNNCAEQFNNMITRRSGGKRINYIMKRSYQTRCYASVVALNSRKELSLIKTKYGKNDPFLLKYEKEKQKKLKQNIINKRKMKRKQLQGTNKNDYFYGECCRKPDMDEVSLQVAKNEFLNSLFITEEEKNNLQELTRDQAHCALWHSERSKRVTASKFGEICKKKETSSIKNLVKSIVHPETFYSKATQYGIENETKAIQDLENYLKKKIKTCGLFIDVELDYIAASPDGILSQSNLIVEIKCPYSARTSTVEEGINKRQITFWKKDMTVNQNHNWYYQVQGQLHITKKPFCMLCVWTPKGIYVEKISRDIEFWKNKMEKPIKKFYLEYVLPEIVDSRVRRGMEIRDRIPIKSK